MPLQPGGYGKCNRITMGHKIRAAKKLRRGLQPIFRPLFNHLLKLAADSTKHGYCARAGREIRMAKLLVEEHGLHGLGSSQKRRRARK